MGSRTILEDGMTTVYVTNAGKGQAYVTACVEDAGAAPDSAAEALYRRIAEILTNRDMQIVHERIFGSVAVQPAVMQARDRALREHGASPHQRATYIEGRPIWGEGEFWVDARREEGMVTAPGGMAGG